MTLNSSAGRALAVRPTTVLATRATSIAAADRSAPHRRLGPAGWVFVAVIVFMSAGLFLTL